jgi:putative peptidoglycan lipid II flippase
MAKNGLNGKFFLKAQTSIISAATVLAITYGISAILGLVRTRLLAFYFGASDELGIFYTADKIPSFLYSLVVVGMFSTIFIPVFASAVKKDKEAAWHSASSVFSLVFLVFLLVTLFVFALAPGVINLLAVGKFSEEQVLLAATLMRIMLGAQIILVVSSYITSVLHSFRYFVVPALAPLFYNVGMILGLVLFVDKMGIYAPAYGVVLGSILHFLIQLPLLKRVQFGFTPLVDFADSDFKEMFRLFPARLVSVAIAQIVLVFGNSLAILISTSSVVILKFALQLQSFPVSLFGSSIAIAALPTLSSESDEESKARFKKTFLTSFHQMMFFVIPTSILLLVLKLPVVRLIFGASKFPWEATVLTSYTLAFFCLSLFAQSGVYLLTRAFYALKDTATPVKVSFVTLLINISLSLCFVLVFKCGVWSVAFAYSIASILDLFAMLYFLSKKVGGFDLRNLVLPFAKISYSAILMGISLYVPLKLLDLVVFDTSRTVPLLLLTAIVSVAGVISYLFFTWLLKVDEVKMLYKLLVRFNVSTPKGSVSPEEYTGA